MSTLHRRGIDLVTFPLQQGKTPAIVHIVLSPRRPAAPPPHSLTVNQIAACLQQRLRSTVACAEDLLRHNNLHAIARRSQLTAYCGSGSLSLVLPHGARCRITTLCSHLATAVAQWKRLRRAAVTSVAAPQGCDTAAWDVALVDAVPDITYVPFHGVPQWEVANYLRWRQQLLSSETAHLLHATKDGAQQPGQGMALIGRCLWQGVFVTGTLAQQPKSRAARDKRTVNGHAAVSAGHGQGTHDTAGACLPKIYAFYAPIAVTPQSTAWLLRGRRCTTAAEAWTDARNALGACVVYPPHPVR